MSDNLKKLTGKNPKDFQPVAVALINNADVGLFAELVEKDDFLFDFVKQNVAQRLANACNNSNYKNLLKFLKYYSPSYEEWIVSTLADYADEDLTDEMLDIFDKGTENEKIYCAKFFSYINDPLSIEYLKQNMYSPNTYLATNCANTLGIMQDNETYNDALTKLNSDDEFEQLEGVKFLVSYGNKSAVQNIIQIAKKSSFAEHIAIEIPYLEDLFTLMETNYNDAMYILNLIINSLGEVANLSQVFDFQIYEIFEKLIKNQQNSVSSIVLANAKDKFETLTENDEYLYDESKDVKQEIMDIKQLLQSYRIDENLIDEELNENSLFIYTALDLTVNMNKVRNLLNSSNQTVILKAIEILKKYNNLTAEDKNLALKFVTNENIRNIIQAI